MNGKVLGAMDNAAMGELEERDHWREQQQIGLEMNQLWMGLRIN